MTLTFVLRLLGRTPGDGDPSAVNGRIEVVRSGQEHPIRSMADLERVLLAETSPQPTDTHLNRDTESDPS